MYTDVNFIQTWTTTIVRDKLHIKNSKLWRQNKWKVPVVLKKKEREAKRYNFTASSFSKSFIFTIQIKSDQHKASL